MPSLGWQELLILLVIVMLIFGAGKLPQVARSLGQGVKEFKQESTAPLTESNAADVAPAASDGEATRSTAV